MAVLVLLCGAWSSGPAQAEDGAGSVSIAVINMSPAALTFTGIGIDGARWIGEPPQEGELLRLYQSRLIRAESDDSPGMGSQSGRFLLTGDGAPIQVEWSLNPTEMFRVVAHGNARVAVEVQHNSNLPHANLTLIGKQ